MEPSIFPARSRLVVIGDIHGDLERLNHLLISTGIMNDKFQWTAEPKDTWVIQMGDQIDSRMRTSDPHDGEASPSPWETTADVQVVFFMRNLDREARRSGGRVISLLGNHEILNALGDMSYVSLKSLNMLGGPKNRIKTFAPGGYMARILADRPVVLQVGPYVFCHAGLLPHHGTDFAHMNHLCRKFLLGFPLSPTEQTMFHELFIDGEGLLWTRAALTEDYQKNKLAGILSSVNATALIVGHNPMPDGITTTQEKNLWFVDTAISRAFDDMGKIMCLELIPGRAPASIRVLVPGEKRT